MSDSPQSDPLRQSPTDARPSLQDGYPTTRSGSSGLRQVPKAGRSCYYEAEHVLPISVDEGAVARQPQEGNPRDERVIKLQAVSTKERFSSLAKHSSVERMNSRCRFTSDTKPAS